MTVTSDYIKQVIEGGDTGSALLRALTAPTLENCKLVDIVSQEMNGLAVLRLPKDHFGVVHSIGGKPSIDDLGEYSRSMVERLVTQAKEIGATPLAFADVVDSPKGDDPLLRAVAIPMRELADKYDLSILNGENAHLGPRVSQVNLTGTMISMIPKNKIDSGIADEIRRGGSTSRQIGHNVYAFFHHKQKPVMINSDGIGTWTEFLERMYDLNSSTGEITDWSSAIFPSLAMKLDDTIKWGAEAVIVSDVAETRGLVSIGDIGRAARRFSDKHNISYIVQHEKVGKRLNGFKKGAPVLNMSGSAVGLIDEELLRHPLKPSVDEYLIAVCGLPNGRSNGISAKRKLMVQEFGANWHKTEEGKIFLQYLSQPATVLYFAFKALQKKGLGTGFFHNSGGAYNGKLARPLAKLGLFAELKDLYNPHWVEKALVGLSGSSMENAYGTWPMGTDGFFATSNPEASIRVIRRFGFNGKVAAKLEKAEPDVRSGVLLKAYNGQEVYFSGKK